MLRMRQQPDFLSTAAIGEALLGPEGKTLDFAIGLTDGQKAVIASPDSTLANILGDLQADGAASPVEALQTLSDARIAGIVIGVCRTRKELEL